MSQTDKYILILGCFDTKGEEFHFLYKALSDLGERILTINTGIRGSTDLFVVDFEAEEVSAEAGSSIQELRKKADRGYAIDKMGLGAARLIAKLMTKGKIKGAIGMGGGGGTFIALSAMQSIPLGVPKVCLSTLAAKDLSRQIGSKDIMLIPSIVDVAGLNTIIKRLILQAAAAISAMANMTMEGDIAITGKIAISMFGNTTACVNRCSEILKKEGYEVSAFHATGVGGLTMESLIRERYFDAVLDITTTELADELCGGILSAGPNRLEAAAEMGIPQVVVPGCLDMVNFAQKDTVPLQYQSRNLYSWAPDVTLMRTDENENRILGRKFIEEINKSSAAAIVLLPLRGISQLSCEGGVFYNPDTDQILFETIKDYAIDPVIVREVNAQINDNAFAELAVTTLLTILEEHKRKNITNH